MFQDVEEEGVAGRRHPIEAMGVEGRKEEGWKRQDSYTHMIS